MIVEKYLTLPKNLFCYLCISHEKLILNLCLVIKEVINNKKGDTMANWFECKVKYDKMLETGQQKKVNEPYIVDALSFAEAEARIIEEITPFISGDFTVSAAKRTRITEIFTDETGDRWYNVKYNIITIDEKTAVEKKQSVLVLVQASDFQKAVDNFMQGMKGTMADFEIASVMETQIMDVYPLKLGEKSLNPATQV